MYLSFSLFTFGAVNIWFADVQSRLSLGLSALHRIIDSFYVQVKKERSEKSKRNKYLSKLIQESAKIKEENKALAVE